VTARCKVWQIRCVARPAPGEEDPEAAIQRPRLRLHVREHGDGRFRLHRDTRHSAWSRERYQAGVEIELSKRWRIEPYYRRQEDHRPSRAHENGTGLVLKILLPHPTSPYKGEETASGEDVKPVRE